MRYFFFIQYQGSTFSGWQSQKNSDYTIQSVFEKALFTYFKTPISIVGCGRTDAGVHAKIQVAHADIAAEFDLQQWRYRLNALLPESIALLDVKPVIEEAHARFHAIDRAYQYHLHFKKNPFLTHYSLYYPYHISIEKLHEGAKIITSQTDFQSFSKVKTDVKNYKCVIFDAFWQTNNHEAVFFVRANRFLRGMVRALVGTQLQYAAGKFEMEEWRNIFAAKSRTIAGPSVSPNGLYLYQVNYPSSLFL